MSNAVLPTLPREILNFARQNYVGAEDKSAPVWTSFSGGRTNRIWLLQHWEDCGATGTGKVFKLFDTARSNVLFPNDPGAEARLLTMLTGRGLAPDLLGVFETSQGRCLVYSYLPGQPLKRIDPETMRRLSELHRVPVDAELRAVLRSVNVSPQALMREGMSFLSGLEGADAQQLWAATPAEIDIVPGPPVLLHGDPVPANVIASGNARHFIDWQCPGWGDATADLALALSSAMHHVYGGGGLTVEQVETLLAAYPDTTVVARYRVLAPFYHWRMAAYCVWKAAHGEEIYAEAGRLELARLS